MIWAELFLLVGGVLIGMGLLLGAAAAVAYFMGVLDD
jgi:hypothetical protein